MNPKRGWYLNEKGYPRFSSGPNRGKYVHRVVAEAMLGRPLAKDEDVHHRDGNKQNFEPSNLQVLTHREHGYISAKQHWYVDHVIIPKDKKEWDEYFDTQERAECNQAAL